MRIIGCVGVLGVALALAGCEDREPALAPTEPVTAALGTGNGIEALIAGSAHHTRIVGTDTAVTIFAFSGSRDAAGSGRGSYHYDFRAAGFSVQGPVTCITIAGAQAWVGERSRGSTVRTPRTSRWWGWTCGGARSMAARAGAVDSTTGLGFAFPGSTITAASWCRDQPRVLVMRQVEKGDFRVAGQ